MSVLTLVGPLLATFSIAVLAAAAWRALREWRAKARRYVDEYAPIARFAWSQAEWRRFRALELRRHVPAALRWLVLCALVPSGLWAFALYMGARGEALSYPRVFSLAFAGVWLVMVALRLWTGRFPEVLAARGEVCFFSDAVLLGPVLIEWGHGTGVRFVGARVVDDVLELDLDFLRGGPADTTTEVFTWERERLRLPVPPSAAAEAPSVASWLATAAQSGSGNVPR